MNRFQTDTVEAEEREMDDQILLSNSALLFLVHSDISGSQPWHTCAVLAREILTQRGVDVERALSDFRSRLHRRETLKELADIC